MLWPSRFNERRARCIGRYNFSQHQKHYNFLRPHELVPPLLECPFILNTGLMLLTPLGLREFNERVVSPLRNRSVSSYDGTDQGALNTMLYKHLVWGSRYAILHPCFNVVARGLKSSESRTTKSAVVHFTGLSGRPWHSSFRNSSEWHRSCG